MRDAEDKDGETAMDMAKQQNSREIISLLKEYGVSGRGSANPSSLRRKTPSSQKKAEPKRKGKPGQPSLGRQRGGATPLSATTELSRVKLEHQKVLDKKDEEVTKLREQLAEKHSMMEKDKARMEVLEEQLRDFALQREKTQTQIAMYDLPRTKLGRVIIFANSEFANLDRRRGTDADVANLTTTFENIDYQVVTHRNSTAQEMKDTLEELSSSKVQSSYGCTVVVILSHGTEEGVAGKDGKLMSDDVFFETLGESAKLKGKPKIVLIQACRRRQVDNPADKGAAGGSGEYEDDALQYRESRHTSPGLDLIIVKSAIRNAAAKRHPTKGSLFIEALTDVVSMNCHRLEFEGMLKLVAENMNRRGEQLGFQACPFVCHVALTKRLFLVPRE